MLKKISLLILICFTTNCGYEPLYLKNNELEKPIKNIKLEGDKKINRLIISSLGLKKTENINSGYDLVIVSKKIIDVVSKNKQGNALTYKTSLLINFSLINQGKIFKDKDFNASFIYSNTKDKFDLSQYQDDIETNLINEISEKIFIYLKL